MNIQEYERKDTSEEGARTTTEKSNKDQTEELEETLNLMLDTQPKENLTELKSIFQRVLKKIEDEQGPNDTSVKLKSQNSSDDMEDANMKTNFSRSKRRKEIGKRKLRKYTVDISDSEAMEDAPDDKRKLKDPSEWVQEMEEMEEKGLSSEVAFRKVMVLILGVIARNSEKNTRHVTRAAKPWIYGIDKIQTFENFISDFERYASEQFGRDKRKWVVELRNFLAGDILRTYFSIYKEGIEYTTVITRLKQVCTEERSEMLLLKKQEFWMTSKLKEEKYHEYALRLQSLYELAFTEESRDVNELKQRFLLSIPLEISRRIRMRMGDDVDGRETSWKKIVKWSKEEDGINSSSFQTSQPFQNLIATTDQSSQWSSTTGWVQAPSQKNYLPVYSCLPNDNVYAAGIPKTFNTGKSGINVGNNQLHVRCGFCRKVGHEEKACWRKSGNCLICGAIEHKLNQCPKNSLRGGRTTQVRSVDYYNSRKESQKPRKVTCHLCGKPGHLMAECPFIKKFREQLAENENGQTQQTDHLESTSKQNLN